jgi:hypothetical protein
VLNFIDSHVGLFETCSTFPDLLAEYAPQLTIPGFGGELEPRIEEEFRKSPGKEWTLRRTDFADYPEIAAYSYFHSGMFGPEVSPYEDADHVFWLLSSASLWLPTLVRTTLLIGMKNRPIWMWHEGEFAEALFSAKKIEKVKWTRAVIDDVRSRIHKTVSLLGLCDSEDQLLERFKEEGFAESYLKFEEERTKAQTRK